MSKEGLLGHENWLVTVVEGDTKALFVGEGATSFPGLLHFTFDTYLIKLSVKQEGITYHFFKSLV